MAQRGLNKAMIIGNLGNDPEVRYNQNGGMVANISVATSERWKDANGEDQERTEWHRIAFFGKLAEIAEKYLTKGSKVYVEGSIRTNKYTDKDGVERYSTSIVASEMQMLGDRSESGSNDSRSDSRQDNGQRTQQRNTNRPSGQYDARENRGNQGRQQQGRQPPPPDFDDEIPF